MYLDSLVVIPNELITTGDFKFHLDDVTDPDAIRFTSSLDARGLVQHVVAASHKMGHTLDMEITRDSSPLLAETPTVSHPSLGDSKGNPSGDHLAIYFRANLTKSESARQQVTFRKLREICIPEFINDLSPILNNTDKPLDELVHAYTKGL